MIDSFLDSTSTVIILIIIGLMMLYCIPTSVIIISIIHNKIHARARRMAGNADMVSIFQNSSACDHIMYYRNAQVQ